MVGVDGAGLGQEGLRILSVDSALKGVATEDHIFLLDAERFTTGNQQLLLNNIHTGNHLRHRVLYLNTGVHFDKVVAAIFVKEFEGAGTAVPI